MSKVMKQTYTISSSIILLICVLPFTAYSNKKADLQFNALKLAAAEGDADKQYELAKLYAEGEGVEQNWVEAVKWYRKAAEQGHDLAQFKVGLSYQNGKGVPQSDTEAYVWLNISSENGAPLNGRGRAGKLADEIRVSLSASQLEQAENIAKRLQQQISKQVEENYTKIIHELNADGWEINMKIEDDGTHLARAFRPAKPISNTATAHSPNWRIAFKGLRKLCKEWPVEEPEDLGKVKGD